MTWLPPTLTVRERTDLGTDSGAGPISVNRDRSRSSGSTDTDLAEIHHSAHRLFYRAPAQHTEICCDLLCNVPRLACPTQSHYIIRHFTQRIELAAVASVGVFQCDVRLKLSSEHTDGGGPTEQVSLI